ncbi:MAG: hypothetical protein GY757_01315, partial [bacterium]|nr:hypothetical protein [bacterium]
MFETVTYNLTQPVEEKHVKKLAYLILNNTPAKKVDVEPVERKEIFLSILSGEDPEIVKKTVETIVAEVRSGDKKETAESVEIFKKIKGEILNSEDISAQLIEKG